MGSAAGCSLFAESGCRDTKHATSHPRIPVQTSAWTDRWRQTKPRTIHRDQCVQPVHQLHLRDGTGQADDPAENSSPPLPPTCLPRECAHSPTCPPSALGACDWRWRAHPTRPSPPRRSCRRRWPPGSRTCGLRECSPLPPAPRCAPPAAASPAAALLRATPRRWRARPAQQASPPCSAARAQWACERRRTQQRRAAWCHCLPGGKRGRPAMVRTCRLISSARASPQHVVAAVQEERSTATMAAAAAHCVTVRA
jgi:hypothetical protein